MHGILFGPVTIFEKVKSYRIPIDIKQVIVSNRQSTTIKGRCSMNGGLYRGARRLDADLYYFDRGRVYVLFLELESKLTWRGDSLPEEE